jgi:protein tyrosine phosphatase (PTP) superfamily phosphohydrolase (DUF442 family)
MNPQAYATRRMGRMARDVLLMSAVVLLTCGPAPTYGEPPERHAAEADELAKMDCSGRRDVYRVCDGLYRGGRITPALASELAAMGVKTVVSLRVLGKDEPMIECAGLNYIHIKFQAWRPDDEEVVQFLKLATDKNCQPVYVYCNRGADRTGMMCAVYRVLVCGWSREEALHEMSQGPFGYNPIWKKLRCYVETFDAEYIKCRAGL